MLTNVAECGNDIINDITVYAGWWVDNIVLNNCNSKLTSGTGGNIKNFKCNTGIKKVIYKDGDQKLGYIKFVCDDGKISDQYGTGMGGGRSYTTKEETFTCPPNEYLYSIKAKYDKDGIFNNSIGFTCKPKPNDTIKNITTSPEERAITSSELNTTTSPEKNTTTSSDEETKKLRNKLYLIISIITLIIIIIAFILYKKKKK